MKAGHTQSNIIDLIGVNKSTIRLKQGRNSGWSGNQPQQAHHLCLQMHNQMAAPQKDLSTWALVEILICEGGYPEQISVCLQSGYKYSISIEWIYQFILTDKQSGGTQCKYLLYQKQRKKRYGVYSYRGHIPHQVSIQQRPAIVDKRSRYGDWGLDTVICKTPASFSELGRTNISLDTYYQGDP